MQKRRERDTVDAFKSSAGVDWLRFDADLDPNLTLASRGFVRTIGDAIS
jgi:hypothetical protein